MYTTQADKVLLGRGKVYFDRFNSSLASTGLRFLGDVSKLEITTNDDKAQLYDYSVNTAPLLNEIVAKREVTFAMTLHEYLKENLALALMGAETTYTQTSGTVTAEALGNVTRGRVYRTANRRISAIAVKKGASTLVLGTDYDVVDTELGLIHVREGSVTVSDGDALTIDYTKAAIAAPGLNRVQAATASQVYGAIVFVGDPAAGPAWDVEVWKVTLSPDGVLGWITGTDFGNFELKGKVLPDSVNHPTEPYYRLTQRT